MATSALPLRASLVIAAVLTMALVVAREAGVGERAVSRGIAIADVDGDSDLGGDAGHARFLRNLKAKFAA